MPCSMRRLRGRSSPESARAHPEASVVLRRALAPIGRHLQKGLLLLLGLGFPGPAKTLLGHAAILVGCAHHTLHGRCYQAEKVGYMKLLADGRIKPFRAFPVITIVAEAIG